MIEGGLFLGLGFCLATLLALACLPLVFRRAVRLARTRLALALPGSEAEIAAAHDGLRAQAAVATRRLEQRMEAEQRTAALTRTELGHRTVSLISAEKTGDALRTERAALIDELDALTRAMRDSEGQRGALEKALHDADALIETTGSHAAVLARRHDEARALAEERRGAMLAIETRAASLQARLEDTGERIERLLAEAAERGAALAVAAGAFEREKDLAARLTADLAAERTQLERERARGEERDRRLLQRSDALAAAEARMAEQETMLAERHAEITALQARFAALEAELKARHGAGADQQALAEADALLRSAIIAVGDDALRVLAPGDEWASPSQPAGERP